MDDVHRIDIHTCQPVHHSFELAEHIIEIKIVALNCCVSRPNLFAGNLVAAAVNCIEKTLRKVRASAEELHLLAHEHWGYAARDGSIVSPSLTHDLVTFELDGTRVDRYSRDEAAEAFR